MLVNFVKIISLVVVHQSLVVVAIYGGYRKTSASRTRFKEGLSCNDRRSDGTIDINVKCEQPREVAVCLKFKTKLGFWDLRCGRKGGCYYSVARTEPNYVLGTCTECNQPLENCNQLTDEEKNPTDLKPMSKDAKGNPFKCHVTPNVTKEMRKKFGHVKMMDCNIRMVNQLLKEKGLSDFVGTLDGKEAACVKLDNPLNGQSYKSCGYKGICDSIPIICHECHESECNGSSKPSSAAFLWLLFLVPSVLL